MQPSLNSLLMVAVAAVILIVICAVLMRAWLRRVIFKGGRARRDTEAHTLLRVMGTRMDRPWMTAELMAVAGLSLTELETLLRASRRYIRREWQDHPVTGEEFEAIRLNAQGVREFGQYAPDDMDSLPVYQETDEVIDLAEFRPVVQLGRAAQPDEDDEEDVTDVAFTPEPAAVPPSPAPTVTRGFRHTRR